jgi:hypothetical protein
MRNAESRWCRSGPQSRHGGRQRCGGLPYANRLVCRPYRFFFFSNEGREPPHIHVKAGSDEAKYLLRPVQLAANYGFNVAELNEIEQIVNEHRERLLGAWHEHFG